MTLHERNRAVYWSNKFRDAAHEMDGLPIPPGIDPIIWQAQRDSVRASAGAGGGSEEAR